MLQLMFEISLAVNFHRLQQYLSSLDGPPLTKAINYRQLKLHFLTMSLYHSLTCRRKWISLFKKMQFNLNWKWYCRSVANCCSLTLFIRKKNLRVEMKYQFNWQYPEFDFNKDPQSGKKFILIHLMLEWNPG